jgi:DNA-binding NtrC family response regulator
VLHSGSVDLVLTDQLMPGGTGTELAKSIKQIWPDLPVVLISGVNEIPADATHTDLFISKVEGPKAMCEKIAAVLEQTGRAAE